MMILRGEEKEKSQNIKANINWKRRDNRRQSKKSSECGRNYGKTTINK